MKVFVQHPRTLEFLTDSYEWNSSAEAAKDFQHVHAAVDLVLALNLKQARVVLKSEDPAELDFTLPAMALAA